MMHALFENTAQCCGCGTCALVCPVNAIEMIPQELGALYPKVDTEKCIDCQMCVRNCAYQTVEKSEKMPLQAYAAAAADKRLLQKSASGGVFATLASAVLDAGGAVFGCSLEMTDGKLTPKHICVESHEELYKLQGSKYVQSELGDTFKQIKQLLKQGRTVLFSGTPCQVDALKKYTHGVETQDLYTIDLICHGVPGAKLFQDYLVQLCSKPVEAFYFRDKTRGWGLNAKYCYRNNRGEKKDKLLPPDVSSYYAYFLESETYRQSCYTCRYASMNRVGDITAGDFWGIEQEHPEFLTEEGGSFAAADGISAILVNTEKGNQLLTQYGQELSLKETLPEAVAKRNGQLNHPSKHTVMRQKIVEVYEKTGYAGVEKVFRQQVGVRLPVRKLKHICKKWTGKIKRPGQTKPV